VLCRSPASTFGRLRRFCRPSKRSLWTMGPSSPKEVNLVRSVGSVGLGANFNVFVHIWSESSPGERLRGRAGLGHTDLTRRIGPRSPEVLQKSPSRISALCKIGSSLVQAGAGPGLPEVVRSVRSVPEMSRFGQFRDNPLTENNLARLRTHLGIFSAMMMPLPSSY